MIRGKLTEGMELLNTRTGNKEKVSQLFAVAGKNRIKVTELAAGDIGCTVNPSAVNLAYSPGYGFHPA